MRNRWQTAGLLIAAAFLAAACGPFTSSSGSSGSGYGSAPSSKAAAPSSGQATLKTAQSSGGTILANAGGYVLYYYSADKPGSGTSACTGSCATAWPPLTGTVKTPTGMTLPGPLGAITLAGGKKQVTINGYPIYLYAGDHSAGQDSGNGVGGVWHVVKISGSPSSSSSSPSPSPSSGSSSSTSGAGGYGGGGY